MNIWHIKLVGRSEINKVVQRQTLTAALIAFRHQLATYRGSACRQQIEAQGLRVAAPLWVLLGLSCGI